MTTEDLKGTPLISVQTSSISRHCPEYTTFTTSPPKLTLHQSPIHPSNLSPIPALLDSQPSTISETPSLSADGSTRRKFDRFQGFWELSTEQLPCVSTITTRSPIYWLEWTTNQCLRHPHLHPASMDS